jgi:hypothetical protein
MSGITSEHRYMTAIHSAAAPGNETWRVGILYSRSGVTAVTESEHFFGTVLAIEEINARGGVRGRLLDPVVFDPHGDLGAYRRLAGQMLSREGVNVIFGCSTSSSRKAVLPELERKNGLLWYCSLYEGFEYSPNIIYTGAVPNQNSLQLAAYLLRNCGKRMYLIGSDYIYPRESNRIMRDFFERHGGEIVDEIYLPFDVRHEQIEAAVDDIYRDRPEVVFSTVIGRPARDFYRVLHDAGRAGGQPDLGRDRIKNDRPAILRRPHRLGNLLQLAAVGAEPALPGRLPAPLRRRRHRQRLGPGGLQPGASVRRRAAAGRLDGHAKAGRGGVPRAPRRARGRARGRSRQPPPVAAAEDRRGARRRRLRRRLAGGGTGQARPLSDHVRVFRILAKVGT